MSDIDPRLRRHALGFLEVAEKPTQQELADYYAKLYFQTERANYRKSYPPDELRYFDLKVAQRAAAVAAIRGTTHPGRLLDVGCGEGFALAWFAAEGWDVDGIDFSSAGVEAMNPAMLPHLQTGDLFALLGEKIEANARFDVVWLTNVLEHVPDPVALLVRLRRLVADDGVLVVTVPNDGSRFQQRLLEDGDIPASFWVAIPDHLAYFTHGSIATTAEATGWACRDVIADFPIDWFLLHDGSNYVRDRARGPAAHRARLRMELLLGDQPHEDVNAYYRALARVGLGRNLTAFLSPSTADPRNP